IVEAVRKGEGSSGASLRLTAARDDMSKKFRRRFCFRRFRESGREKFPAVIVGTADKNLFPGLRMGGREIVAIGEFINFFWRQFAQQFCREIAEERIAQSVDAFEMFKQQNQPLEM